MSQQDRRLEVSEAAWRVIVREGLDRASMRAIAQEMNCTTGVVTHYFRNKQELILFALHQVTERLKVRMQVAIENVAGIDRLATMLLSFLPLDQERQEILRVWVAFLGYAVGRDGLMEEHRQSAAELRAVIIQELQALQSKGLIQADLVPQVEANALLALVNGIGIDTLIQADHLGPGQQEAIIHRYIAGMVTGQC
ncbi:TetR/AcrR family transcriptional regulator [Acaryochloris marina]|uniref:Transcriptional regulator, TetR family, putative n=1 Tax=Acaryochloris marina (strain MBIC 11017) TaxID=329726 RepID=B0CCI5_ACAM1|nr:TetR/AcrR family transcriptional regulator [Acaryochloris marina]ABW28014.1 transcriptional regulator, TetR family, putative [Acaryochloris marina MBIC11017]BDM82727.1 transcriptional regulator BetI [Acaryochloris marina MBIC10699]